MDRNLLRHISSVCNQLPAMTSKSFEASFLQVRKCGELRVEEVVTTDNTGVCALRVVQEYNDALLVSFLATLTKGATNANTVVDRFSTTQDRHSRSTLL